MSDTPVLPITVAVCSVNPSRFIPAAARMLDVLRPEDQVIVVADVGPDELPPSGSWPASWDGRVRLVCNGSNLGLSASRNRALRESSTHHVVFFDDDIVPNEAAVERLRAYLRAGAHLAGTRITAVMPNSRRPWYFTDAQMHYLGCHRRDRPVTIWGGSLAVDVGYARGLGVTFDETMGHRRGVPAFAEDTVFTRSLADHGAQVAIADDVHVGHLIEPERLTLAYLTRRARAQGRSELQRNNVRAGLAKEWARNTDVEADALKAWLLATLYLACVASGVIEARVRSMRADGTRLRRSR